MKRSHNPIFVTGAGLVSTSATIGPTDSGSRADHAQKSALLSTSKIPPANESVDATRAFSGKADKPVGAAQTKK